MLMFFRKKHSHRTKQCAQVVTLVVAGVVLWASSVSAGPPPEAFGRGHANLYHSVLYYRTFFDDRSNLGPRRMLNVLPAEYRIANGEALMQSTPYHARQYGDGRSTGLIGFLKERNRSGNLHKQTGSAFVVYSMLGRKAHPGTTMSRHISDSDWAELENRLRMANDAGLIEWNGLIRNYDAVNTAYYNGDIVPYYDGGVSGSSMIIRYPSGAIAYILRYECANPIGDTDGIPVVYNYQLRPLMDIGRNTIPQGVTSIGNVRADMENSGQTQSKNVDTAIVRFVVRRHEIAGLHGFLSQGGEVTADIHNANSLYTSLSAKMGNPSFLSSHHAQVIDRAAKYYPRGTTSIRPPSADSITDLLGKLQVGDRICYLAATNRYSHTAGDTQLRYSTTKCAIASGAPKAQFWGGDVYVGGDVYTSISEAGEGPGASVYGSWSEYEIIAGGTVRSSSGAGLSSGAAGRVGLSGADALSYNKLTFSNAPTLGGYGSVPVMTLPPLLSNTVGAAATGGTRSIEELASRERWTTHGDLVLRGGELAQGRTLIINAGNHTVRIAGNIRYAAGGYTSVNQIPQIIIIAKNIIIEQDVTEVNAWLMALNGYISTCGAVNSPAEWLQGLNASVCNKQLQINGPLSASRIFMRRTYAMLGASHTSHNGTPAEILNFRPDAHLWGYRFSGGSRTIKTMYVRELPPRF